MAPFSVHEDLMLPRPKCGVPETLAASLQVLMTWTAGDDWSAQERGLGA
jgi:hypothetical protein